jgi:hypothetical protein
VSKAQEKKEYFDKYAGKLRGGLTGDGNQWLLVPEQKAVKKG